MLRVTAAFLLLLQLGPFVGAGLCMHAATQPRPECAMPMPGMTEESGRPDSTPMPDCAQLALCGPAAPVIPVAVHACLTVAPGSTDYSTPASLLPGEPITPPQPPPIA